MPKKKSHQKDQNKSMVQRQECFTHKVAIENNTNEQFNKRQIKSNWAKYERPLPEHEDFNDENPCEKVEKIDFAFLVKNASSDCSYFEFNSEKLWKNEDSTMHSNSIFNLDLHLLSQGLACLPFYDRMGLDIAEFTAKEKAEFDIEAQRNWESYNDVAKNFIRNLSKNREIVFSSINDEMRKRCAESSCINVDFGAEDRSKTPGKSDGVPEPVHHQTCQGIQTKDLPTAPNITKDEKSNAEPNALFGNNCENLEEWLDSVLDD